MEFNARQRPFGSLARRTIGDMFGAKDTARCGLELSYDSILRGKKGLLKRRKVMNKYLSITEMEAIDGADIVTTIDVGMQDLAERAVIDELREINGNVGVAIVMEVHTGDIKAIVNMTKCSDGEYREVKNNAVADLLEPGSVFKTASLMVALDDGVVDTTYMVETGSGIWDMYGAKMRDHNWHKGGYQTISLPRTLEVSSNIGVSRIIDRFYGKNPEKFVEGINRLGLSADLHLPLVGATAPRIRMPKKNDRGQYVNWSKTALPWMSIGYETQIPPISTLTFYNAIANNGKMVRPRFVQRIVKDGEVIQEFPDGSDKGENMQGKDAARNAGDTGACRQSGTGQESRFAVVQGCRKDRNGTGVERCRRLQDGHDKLSVELCRVFSGRRSAIQLHRMHTEIGTSGIGRRNERTGVPQHCRRHNGPEPEAGRCRRTGQHVDIHA